MPKSSAVCLLFILASTSLIRINQSANVLCMFTSTARTQLILFMAVANTLIDRGHNVTVITTREIPAQSISKKPFRHVLLEEPDGAREKLTNSLDAMNDLNVSKVRAMATFIVIIQMLITIQTGALERETFQKFFDEDNHFDLVLLGYFHNDYLLGMGARYRCPTAVICLGTPYGPINRMVGNPEETSYVQFPAFGRNQHMSFVERSMNLFWAVIEPLIQMHVNRLMEQFYRKLFAGDQYPEYSEVITNVSLVLANSHFSEFPVRPLVPALVEIGGIQNKDQPDPLPEDIREFLDTATNGSILFSVGSKIRGTSLKPSQFKIIFNVFSRLDMRVLWELEDHDPPAEASLSPNILFKQWIPIEDVVCHKSVKLFVTDGRPNAIYLAQYRGIPMLGMPIIGDEPYNVEDMKGLGFGVAVDLPTMTEESLQGSVDDVLQNPRYKQSVQQFSNIYRDRPLTARESAAFWLEYVIRYRGAHHMQSPVVKMSFVKYWNLDVIAVMLFGLYVFVKLAGLVARLSRILWARRSRKYKVC